MSKKALKVSQKKNVLRFFLFLCLGLIAAMTLMVFSQKATAEEDLTYSEKAREKKFLGGADEGELKVLALLPSLKNKKTVTEDAEEGF